MKNIFLIKQSDSKYENKLLFLKYIVKSLLHLLNYKTLEKSYLTSIKSCFFFLRHMLNIYHADSTCHF